MNVELPESVQEIADAIGRERALYLAGQLPQCGTRNWRRSLYVPTPARLHENCQLVQLIGWDDARKLAEYMPGAVLQPGSCKELERRWRDLSIRKLHKRGFEDLDQLASWFGLTRRYIRAIIFGV